ncbi:MAG TPA: DUF790 family protein [Polyangiaceae bacterium]|nr:DUF790 family protein [Polyangiaceae bacterium]
MLAAEHVQVRRTGERLVLVELSAKKRLRALELAEQILETARAHVQATRDDLDEALGLIGVAPNERKLFEGLKKLVEEYCEFGETPVVDPAALRSELFAKAAQRRKHSEVAFDRAALVQEVAAERGLDVQQLEDVLYADLRGAHRLLAVPQVAAAELVTQYDRGQVQAILLRAVSLVVNVTCKSPDAYRALFHKLKFRRLLYRMERRDPSGYRLEIDGPFSLFDAGTKYGLELACTLPALQACDLLELSARVLWGKQRTPLLFEYRSQAAQPDADAAHVMRDEVRELCEDFAELSEFRCRPCEEIFEVAGQGVCVPDLVFEPTRGGAPIYLEMLGYWSRDAVFRRVELVERGLAPNLLFAVSSKLRVSEEVLASEHSALYVFKGRPNARAILRKLQEIHAKRGKR